MRVMSVQITMKDDDQTLKKEFFLSSQFASPETEELVERCLKETRGDFKGHPQKVKITASIEV